jgi:hypothetical protein
MQKVVNILTAHELWLIWALYMCVYKVNEYGRVIDYKMTDSVLQVQVSLLGIFHVTWSGIEEVVIYLCSLKT